MRGEPPSWTRGYDIIKIMQVEGAKVHNHLRTHGSEGVTKPGRNGPGPVSPGRPAQPTPGVGSAPLSLHLKDLQPLNPGGAAIRRRRQPFAAGGHPQARERGGRSPEGGRPPRRKHPQVEKKEDTVGRVTMINGAMSSTLMG
jgi:hypothetical protein